MISLDLSIPSTEITELTAKILFYWNVASNGIASGDVFTQIGTKQPLFTGTTPTAKSNTPLVCFGMVRAIAKAFDECGNVQSGTPQESTFFVNSTPEQPLEFKRSEFTGGRQWFSFVESPQLEV